MSAYSKNEPNSLLQLSEEVGRIAGTLARLSALPTPAGAAVSGEKPRIAVAAVGAVIRARQLRERYFPQDLFADPAWDIMLDLLHAELSHRRVAVSSLCLAAGVPATTALRWIKSMVDQDILIRHADPHDGRRVFVELAPDTSLALHRYFAELEGLTAN